MGTKKQKEMLELKYIVKCRIPLGSSVNLTQPRKESLNFLEVSGNYPTEKQKVLKKNRTSKRLGVI